MIANLLRREINVLGHLIFTSAMVFAPMMAFVGYMLWSNSQSDQNDIWYALSDKAKSTAAALDMQFGSITTLGESLATSPYLKQGDYKSFYSQARELSNGEFSILLADANGKLLVNTAVAWDKTPSLPMSADRDTDMAVIISGQPTVSPIFIGSITKQSIVNSAVRAPCGASVCSLKISIRSDHIGQNLKKMEFKEVIPNSYISIIDQTHSVIANTEVTSRGNKVSQEFIDIISRSTDTIGHYHVTAYTGIPVDGVYVRLKNVPWTVVAAVPHTEMTGPFWRYLQKMLGIAVVWLVLTVIVVTSFGRRIQSGLRKILNMSRLAEKKLTAGIPYDYQGEPTGVSEITDVSNSLALMARRVQTHQLSLAENDERIRLLIREVMHRAKNQLTVIQSIVSQSIRKSSSMTEFEKALSERLQGLSETQNLLVKADWKGATIEGLIRSHLRKYVRDIGERIILSGPQLVLLPEPSHNLGMVFHELATNAGKYGAMSTDSGTISIEWFIQGDEFHISWIEAGGPPVIEPTKKGFGFAVITRVAESSLSGKVSIEYAETGFHWDLIGSTSYFVQAD